ncbi:hypothetical protein RHGRI_010594 [Rhododendron griersonianum]|uniref:ATP-dependent DNA helicase n=1 Tax=Rhododendron griersonianum TaxID=479676 RepID=A0AAV6KJ58_9ERIC|nr:hypothetical protein RHGRI_010594 [Rhododendron griersonianum]
MDETQDLDCLHQDEISWRRFRQRKRYAKFTPTQRAEYIQKSMQNRKRKRNAHYTPPNTNHCCEFSDGKTQNPLPTSPMEDNLMESEMIETLVAYLPITFALLTCEKSRARGVDGSDTKKVSCREYYCYKLQIRDADPSVLLLSGRLLQQYVVDMYIKLENTRLDYFRQKQSDIRVELYQGIVDSVLAGESRGGVKAVKYLYKYIYKGHDKIVVDINHNEGDVIIDKIKQFQDARWVSAQEAMWRIFEFELYEMYPSVINLPLHLPNKQTVPYGGNQDLENIINSNTASRTMLIEFFKFCLHDKEKTPYLYREFLEYFVWNRKGRPTSYADLLTVNGVKCSSFKEAAEKRGLLQTDNWLSECLADASSFQMPQAMRHLFAVILVYCDPSANEELRLLKTLKSINLFLESIGKSTKDYDLPAIKSQIVENESFEKREVLDELAVKNPPEDCLAPAKLNPEQKSNEMIALATATSGVAASILPGGRTAHSRFQLPIDGNDSSQWAIEALDRSLKDIMSNNSVFGGKVIVFGGDFRQVLPVVPRGTRAETVHASLAKSYLWTKMQKLILKTNMRAQSDSTFSDFLLRVGSGVEPTEDENMIEIHEDMIVRYQGRSCESCLINAVFPSRKENANSAEYITQRAILATRNESVDMLND